MTSERMQRRIESLLDQADEAVDAGDWPRVVDRSRAVLALEADNTDAQGFLAMAEANGVASDDRGASAPFAALAPVEAVQPTSFAGGRYEVRRFLGEGGKKRVFLAHDTRLDRDVAFALIKTEGLDATGRERITREAQAMGRLGAHPHIVTIVEIGDEAGSPYVVNELLGGGDVEGELRLAEGPLPLTRTLEIAKGVARGLAFAHERGIVHRDLKPGNVWLTEDGVAKIGDFGLAVSLDRSRLTQHGMMVGTVAYMPPEQALGGEVTPQADLYSLGAMLYELVTGRPPFQADDPTAIISQHINTPPVAPSWHSEHCPPDLEALILKLLAKVPADRPASANDVLTALEAVDPNARSASHSDSSANPLDRLARGVFVGRERERELERLRAAFDDAFAGRGSVVMLVGEPGIGKTRTSIELETYARMRGGRVIWGRADEAAGAPPYRPWVQAADTYSITWGLETLQPQMVAEDTAELSRIFPLLRQQPNYVAPPEIVDPAAAQFRLFEACTKLLRAFTSEAPIVVVLDDLHWADKPTLLLLQHVARELGRLRLLIVGTYRDTELSRTHPLSEALAELNREGGFQRVNLAGLERDEVANYIRGTAGIEPSRALVDRVFEETEGNPFFLHEVVNLMTEEGSIASDSVSDIVIPEGVREALGRRLDRLSEEANALLQYAAVAGRQFAYDTLKLVTEHDDDDLLRLIEETLAARVIEETSQAGRYQFTHALMQETLLEELSTTRRVRMHGQVAEAIEQRYRDRADEQAARLAAHCLEASSLDESYRQKALHYAWFAAARAREQAAWAEGARLLEAILGLNAEVSWLDEAEQAQLHLHIGELHALGGRYRDGWRHLMEAAQRFEVLADWAGLVRVAISAEFTNPPPLSYLPLLNRALAGDVRRDRELEARLLVRRAHLHYWNGDFDDQREDVRRAAALSDEIDSQEVLGRLLWLDGEERLDSGAFHKGREIMGQAFQALEAAGDPLSAYAHVQWATSFLGAGELDGARRAYAEVYERARRTGAIFQEQNSLTNLIGVEMLRANIAGAKELASDYRGPPNIIEYITPVCFAELEGFADVEDLLPPVEAAGNVPMFVALARAVRARAYFVSGQRAAARDEVGAWRGVADEIGFRSASKFAAGLIAPVVAEVGEPSDAAFLRDNLLSPGSAVTGWSPTARLNGALALHLDLIDDAERHFRTGLEWCERERCPVEAGRCHQGLAEVAERRGDHALAMQHLDAAGELFSRPRGQALPRPGAGEEGDPAGLGVSHGKNSGEDAHVTAVDLTALRVLAERLGEREEAAPEAYPGENIRELFNAGIVQAAFPSEHGGSGWTLVDCCDAVELIASHSASTALLLSMPLGLGGICGLEPAIAPPEHRDGWAEQTARVAADYAAGKFYAACNSERGAGGNLDATQTIASRQTDGSFRLTGDKILASGGSNAAMFMSSAKVSQADLPGSGVVEFFLVPTATSGVEVKDDWDGFGMRSTESQSVHYEGAIAREMLGFPNFLELIVPTTYWYCIFAAVSLGCVAGILRILGRPAPSSPAVRLRLAESQMRIEAMRAYLRETAREWHPAAPAEETRRVIRMKSYVTSESTKLSAELFALGGGRHYRRNDPAARLLADSFAGTALRPPFGATLDVLADQFSV